MIDNQGRTPFEIALWICSVVTLRIAGLSMENINSILALIFNVFATLGAVVGFFVMCQRWLRNYRRRQEEKRNSLRKNW